METILKHFVLRITHAIVLSRILFGFFGGILFIEFIFIQNVSAAALPNISFGVTLSSAESPKFLPGDRVVVTVAPLKVRDTAEGNVLGTQPLDTLGTIISGPGVESTGNWWNINYDGTLDGWSFETSIEKYVAPADIASPSVPSSLVATSISPTQIDISWLPSTDNTGVIGYKIFRGGAQVDTSNTNSYSDFGLSSSTLYTYAVNAYDAAGNNSAKSASVSTTTKGVVVPVTKFLSGDRVVVPVGPVNVRATPNITTGVLGAVLGKQVASAFGTVVGGPVAVPGNGTWWNINYDTAPDGWSFEEYLEKYISPTDTIAPAPVSISVGNITPNSAALSWVAPGDDGNTGTAASYEIRYSRSLITNVNFGSATRVAVPPLPLLSGTMQSFTAGSLLPNTRYYFAIITKDEASNNSILSNVASFTTATAPVLTDTIPPIISSITLSGFPNTITAQWITNELSDSQAVYGRSSTTLSNTVTVSGLVASHTLTFSELQRKATYYYKIISKDAAGNISISPIGSFQTGPGKTVPIKNLRATQGSVILTWSPSIDEFAQKVVVYRSLSGYPDTMKASDLLATITDLTQTTYRDEAVTPGVTYYYSVFVVDSENIVSEPVHISFTPVAPPVSSGGGGGGGSSGGGGAGGASGGGGGGGGGGFITTPSPVTPPKPPVIQNISSRPQFHYSFVKTLSLGITDGEVQELQKALNILGYAIASDGPGSLGNETPYFGNATAAAIRKFQCDTMQICSGTPTTTGYGLVGKMTRAKLGEKLGTSGVVSVPVSQQNAPAAVAPTPRSFLTRALTLGMTGEDVRTLQNTLKAKGYFPAESETTTYFGQVTLGAIKKFQCDTMQICSGTSAETGYGNVGKMTRSKLGL
jgi:peptidoglycan hydrolase-like protein with peptidoglycan-binding domain/uncharacterized membrane protein YgcG